ncbi:MAG: hypothetical protein V1809_13230 [Planctomycetota bacterium]
MNFRILAGMALAAGAVGAVLAGGEFPAAPGGTPGLVWDFADFPSLVYRDEGAVLSAAIAGAAAVPREGTLRWEVRDSKGNAVGRGGPKNIRLGPGERKNIPVSLGSFPSGGEVRFILETPGASPDRRTLKIMEAAAPDIPGIVWQGSAFSDLQGNAVVFLADREDAGANRTWGISKWVAEKAVPFPSRLWVVGDVLDAPPGETPPYHRELARLAPPDSTVEFIPRRGGGGFFADAVALDRKLAGGAPDMIFIVPGLLDGRSRIPVDVFRRGLDFLVERVRVRGAGKTRLVIAGPAPYPVEGEIERLQAEAVRNLAREHGIRFADIGAELADRDDWKNAFRDGEDPVFRPWPDAAGQKIFAEVLRRALP